MWYCYAVQGGSILTFKVGRLLGSAFPDVTFNNFNLYAELDSF